MERSCSTHFVTDNGIVALAVARLSLLFKAGLLEKNCDGRHRLRKQNSSAGKSRFLFDQLSSRYGKGETT